MSQSKIPLQYSSGLQDERKTSPVELDVRVHSSRGKPVAQKIPLLQARRLEESEKNVSADSGTTY
ncbi:MAG: hypothetical protein JSU80_13470 [Deltaproteobacteria bacterium]|nr:MAG: hypothetical protein JSU80_13470 [Deltaproteobacteria bacterium]